MRKQDSPQAFVLRARGVARVDTDGRAHLSDRIDQSQLSIYLLPSPYRNDIGTRVSDDECAGNAGHRCNQQAYCGEQHIRETERGESGSHRP